MRVRLPDVLGEAVVASIGAPRYIPTLFGGGKLEGA
jgi:hypothetical protein